MLLTLLVLDLFSFNKIKIATWQPTAAENAPRKEENKFKFILSPEFNYRFQPNRGNGKLLFMWHGNHLRKYFHPEARIAIEIK